MDCGMGLSKAPLLKAASMMPVAAEVVNAADSQTRFGHRYDEWLVHRDGTSR